MQHEHKYILWLRIQVGETLQQEELFPCDVVYFLETETDQDT